MFLCPNYKENVFAVAINLEEKDLQRNVCFGGGVLAGLEVMWPTVGADSTVHEL